MDPLYGDATQMMQYATTMGPYSSLFSLIVYVFIAYCIQRIAHKLNTPNAWLAWIPVANVFLLAKMAEKSYLSLLWILVPIANLVYIIVLWIKIIKRLNMSPWLVVLFFVPIANIVTFGYLAFSK
jgi:hypothetical protein